MFDAALSLLEGAAFAIRGHCKDRVKAEKDCREIANACIVLQAAAKIKRPVWYSDAVVADLIHAALDANEPGWNNAALPDAPKGKE